MSALRRGLSAYIPVKNAFKLDYCVEQVAASLLPIADELIISDGGSTDGTIGFFDSWAKREPKIRIVHFPWPNVPTYEMVRDKLPGPPGQPRMLVDWLNFTRRHCRFDMQITSDADEPLCPKSYPAVRDTVADMGCLWFWRAHFWRDAQHITSDGTVVGAHVARLGPTVLEMVSDEPRPEGEPPIRKRARYDDRARFLHYGFIRRKEAFFAKSKIVAPWIANSYDPRLLQAEITDTSWFDLTDIGDLKEWKEPHPEFMHAWLKERGYSPS